MTNFLAQLRSRQHEIGNEIAGHLAAIASLTAELGDIASTVRVFARLRGNEQTSTAPVASSAEQTTAPAKHVAQASTEPMDAGGVHDGLPVHPATNSPAGKSGGEASASSPAPSLASQLRKLNAEHPEYTLEQAANALGISKEKAHNNSSAHKLKWARVDGWKSPVGLGDRVETLHRQHPDWPASRIAAELETSGDYVRATAQRRNPKLPSERIKPVEVEQPRQETQERPDDVPVIPADLPSTGQAGEEAEAIVELPRAARPLSGSKFYLVNDEGQYLNRYCAGFTTDKREAWIGNQSQLVGCRRNFEIARDLTEKPVVKSAPVPINREVA